MNEGRTVEITQKNNESRNGGYAGDIMKHEEQLGESNICQNSFLIYKLSITFSFFVSFNVFQERIKKFPQGL